MAVSSKNKSKPGSCQTQRRRAKKAEELVSITHLFNRIASRKNQAIVSKDIVRIRWPARMTDKENRREIVPEIQSWKSQPSPLHLVTTPKEAAAAAFAKERKRAKCPFDDSSSDEEEENDLEAFQEQCRRWSRKGKGTVKKEAKKRAKPKTRTEQREMVLREILERKAEKRQGEACAPKEN
ncbi:hypothetical protein N0V93_006439 [Gnomoniopsis smithogilvyi]|uniref:Uncharacterized protein n=1 Tax=Gnomoniopsis smithogilvyi TaxID=1191159 RepID=A0A9W8YN82_9PEZI|nr:hypothetical protein N0V93_006439 [Gnomoniopsis smithogilvyi]